MRIRERVKCLSSKHKDMSSVPRVHAKKKKSGQGGNAGEVRQADPRELLASQPRLTSNP